MPEEACITNPHKNNIMKTTTSIIRNLGVCLLIAFPLWMNAQQVNYKIMKDNPKDVNNFWLYLDVAQMDGGYKNIEGFSFNLGLWGVADYKERLGAEFIARYGYLTFGKSFGGGEGLRSHYQGEAGVFLNFSVNEKVKNTKVILSQSTSYSGSYKVTTTRYLMVPATRITKMGVRGGITSMGGTFGTSGPSTDETVASAGLPDMINYSMTGIYLGLLNTKVNNVLVNTDTDGKCGNFRYSRVYVDALIFPVRTAGLDGVDYKDKVKPGMIGARLGWYVMPTESRKMKGYDVKTRGSAFGVEVGIRPFDGIFVTGTWSIALMRKKSAKLGYTVPESEKNTSE
jgi:hypothetical protein